MAPQTLSVQFKGARQLFNTSSWGSQSPYARCWTSTTRDSKFEGRISKDTGTSAVWNDTANLSVADAANEYFYVEIKAKGRMSDTLIGRLKVSCAELPGKETEMTLKVITESGENGGEIHIVVSLKDNIVQYTQAQQANKFVPEPANAPAITPQSSYTAPYVAPPVQQYSVFNGTSASSQPVQPVQQVQTAQTVQSAAPTAAKSPWRSTVHSSTGKTFWYNTDTKETSWETPVELASAPTPTPQSHAATTPSQATYVSAGQYIRDVPLPSPQTNSYTPASAPSAPTPAPAPVAAAPYTYANNSFSNQNSSGQYVRDVPAPLPQTYSYAQRSYPSPAPAPAPAPQTYSYAQRSTPAPAPVPAVQSNSYAQRSTLADSPAYGCQTSSYTQSYSTNYPGQTRSSGFESVGAYPGSNSSSSAFDSSSRYPGSTTPSGFGSGSYYPGQASNSFGEPDRNQQPQKTRFTCSTCTFEGVSYQSSGTISCEMCGASVQLGRPQTAYAPRVPHAQQASYGPAPLPEFWEERSSNGKSYYVNHVTKTTTWTRPS